MVGEEQRPVVHHRRGQKSLQLRLRTPKNLTRKREGSIYNGGQASRKQLQSSKREALKERVRWRRRRKQARSKRRKKRIGQRSNLQAINPYDLQKLVAALLRAMGY